MLNDTLYIQRCKFTDHKGEVTGVDQLLDYDYMGSSEFEFGALNRSLISLALNAQNLSVFQTKFKHTDGRSVFIIGDRTQEVEYLKIIDCIMTNKYRYKEYPYFKESLSPNVEKKYLCQQFEFWWDIKNHWMFGFGKKNVERVLKGIIAYEKRLPVSREK